MKEQLINFLKQKQAVLTVEEVNQVIGIVNNLEEPEEKKPKKK